MIGLFFLKPVLRRHDGPLLPKTTRNIIYVHGIDGFAPGDIVHVDNALCLKEDKHHPLELGSMNSGFYWAWLTLSTQSMDIFLVSGSGSRLLICP
jgi:hypothetical protein